MHIRPPDQPRAALAAPEMRRGRRGATPASATAVRHAARSPPRGAFTRRIPLPTECSRRSAATQSAAQISQHPQAARAFGAATHILPFEVGLGGDELPHALRVACGGRVVKLHRRQRRGWGALWRRERRGIRSDGLIPLIWAPKLVSTSCPGFGPSTMTAALRFAAAFAACCSATVLRSPPLLLQSLAQSLQPPPPPLASMSPSPSHIIL